jgi:hypothetical protein
MRCIIDNALQWDRKGEIPKYSTFIPKSNTKHYKTGHRSNLTQIHGSTEQQRVKQDPHHFQTPKVSTAVLNVDGAALPLALPLAVGKPKLGPVPDGKGLVPVWA